jgi:cytochrome c peroxidase
MNRTKAPHVALALAGPLSFLLLASYRGAEFGGLKSEVIEHSTAPVAMSLLSPELLETGSRDASLGSLAVVQTAAPKPTSPSLDRLPPLATRATRDQVELGKVLFFDPRLAGDGSTSCASCHDPGKAWTDGLPLSKGYPGSLYFRNTPTVLNVAHGRYLYWDGRLPASDLPTVVRDHLSEAHFMQADGRLLIERLRHIPAYESGFKRAFGGEPTYARILDAVAAFVRTLRSHDVPFDRYLGGEETAISPAAKRGIELFRGKANCARCHTAPMLSDGEFHNLGLMPNPEIVKAPERHITFRRFFKMFGVSEFARLRDDVGLYAITKRPADRGRFRTPTLREVSRTPPYMHDGSVATLEEVVEFYDRGGGIGPGKSALLRPLGLDPEEKRALVAFLETLAGLPVTVDEVELPNYEIRTLGAQ